MIRNIQDILIVGKGIVGKTIGKLVEDTDLYTVEYEDPFQHIFAPEGYRPDLIHICFPLYDHEQFLTDVIQVINRFIMQYDQDFETYGKPIVIIDSTIVLNIMPNLCGKYFDHENNQPLIEFVYSPIRSPEKDMLNNILKYDRYFAIGNQIVTGNFKNYRNEDYDTMVEFMNQYYASLGFEVKVFENTETLVLGKLAAVSWYTMNIAYAQQLFQICRQKGLDFNETYIEFNKDEKVGHQYDPITHEADYLMDRPIFTPGKIEGKCCIPDAQLMLKYQYGAPQLWQWILQTNYQQGMQKMVIENPYSNLADLDDEVTELVEDNE